MTLFFFFFFQAEDGIRDVAVTGVQTCALPISRKSEVRLVFLGTGTSFGVPQIGCSCRTCASTDPRDKRTRTAALIETHRGGGGAGGGGAALPPPPPAALPPRGRGRARGRRAGVPPRPRPPPPRPPRPPRDV